MMVSVERVLAVGAPLDNVKFMCAGLLVLVREAAGEIHIATVSLGDVGSINCGPEDVRSIRRDEAEMACGVIGAIYHSLDFWNFSIFNDDKLNRRVTALLRDDVDPSIVITHQPQDYLADYEATSTLVRNACFYAPVSNYNSLQWTYVARASSIPYLYYSHSIDGMDTFGNTVAADVH